MRILDPFCGAGGAATGYHRAGFEVTGIDIAPQPRYPFEFIQADAMEVLEELASSGCWLLPPGQRWQRRCLDVSEFDAIHASPPCQAWSQMSHCQPGLAATYPQLIDPVREHLQAIGLPYVIENVPGSPLLNPVMLCGTSFGLGANGLEIRRHRFFETSFPAPAMTCAHKGYVMNPHNVAARQRMRERFGYDNALMKVWAREVDVSWMTDDEARESIPPAFTEYIGKHLSQYISSQSSVTSIAA